VRTEFRCERNVTATKKRMVVKIMAIVITMADENHAKIVEIMTGNTIKSAATKIVRI
jgi:hypothetical protein